MEEKPRSPEPPAENETSEPVSLLDQQDKGSDGGRITGFSSLLWGFKRLASALFLLYQVFATCWLTFSIFYLSVVEKRWEEVSEICTSLWWCTLLLEKAGVLGVASLFAVPVVHLSIYLLKLHAHRFKFLCRAVARGCWGLLSNAFIAFKVAVVFFLGAAPIVYSALWMHDFTSILDSATWLMLLFFSSCFLFRLVVDFANFFGLDTDACQDVANLLFSVWLVTCAIALIEGYINIIA